MLLCLSMTKAKVFAVVLFAKPAICSFRQYVLYPAVRKELRRFQCSCFLPLSLSLSCLLAVFEKTFQTPRHVAFLEVMPSEQDLIVTSL